MKTPQEYSQSALDNLRSGMNCSQATLCAFCDDMHLDASIACKIASSFGGGMGHLGEVCGALTGVFMAAGIMYGFDVTKYATGELPSNITEIKAEHYQRIQKLAKSFKDKHKTYLCRELLASDDSKNNSICVKAIIDAAYIFGLMLCEDKKSN
ncbi:MAG: C-GCAxxG-C-C family protein [Spirochaetales bacterium]